MKQLSRSTRISRIVDWLQSQKAPQAYALRLEVGHDDEPIIACQWERSDPREFDIHAVAREADNSLQNMADESESKINGKLVFYTRDNAVWTSFPVRAEPTGGVQTFAGTNISLLQQQQKHFELAGLQYFKATEAVLGTLSDITGVLKDLVVQRENRGLRLEMENARLRDENSELKGETMEASAIAEQATDAAEEAARQAEELRAKETEDSAMIQIVTSAVKNGAWGGPPGSQGRPKKKRPPEAAGGAS